PGASRGTARSRASRDAARAATATGDRGRDAGPPAAGPAAHAALRRPGLPGDRRWHRRLPLVAGQPALRQHRQRPGRRLPGPGRPVDLDHRRPQPDVGHGERRGDGRRPRAARPASHDPRGQPRSRPDRQGRGDLPGERAELLPAAAAERLGQLHQGGPVAAGQDMVRPTRPAAGARDLRRGPHSGRGLMRGLSDQWKVLILVSIGTFMVVLDTTIVNVALSKIAASFNTSTDNADFILTGYLLAVAVMIPATTYVSQRFGTKRAYLASLTAFTICSGLCAVAPSLLFLQGARVLQGLGGAMIQP